MADDLVQKLRDSATWISDNIYLDGYAGYSNLRHAAADEIESLRAQADEMAEALEGLLRRDERNTCMHEDTFRGGVIWEICSACGAKWADDQGGRPDWRDPPEWTIARTALARYRGEGT